MIYGLFSATLLRLQYALDLSQIETLPEAFVVANKLLVLPLADALTLLERAPKVRCFTHRPPTRTSLTAIPALPMLKSVKAVSTRRAGGA